MERKTVSQVAYPVRAYLYRRFSTVTQRDGNSLERQADWARAWCLRKGINFEESLTLTDAGVSGFRGANHQKGGLSVFMAACAAGRVQRGSFLIVENLDRLTREHPLEGIGLVRTLIQDYGVTVVTMHPEMEFRSENMDVVAGILLYVEMARGHSESAARSVRARDYWERKRKVAGEQLVTRKVPSWVRVVDDKLVLIEPKAAVVQRIFDMALSGFGRSAIAKCLNREGVPPLGKARFWHESYVEKILHNRAVLGEYQPRRAEDGKRVPVGPVIRDYFPGVVSPETFLAAQQAMADRRSERGEVRFRVSNLFTGLVYEGGERMAMRATAGVRYLQTGRRETPGVRYDHFERVLLWGLREAQVRLDNENTGTALQPRAKSLDRSIALLEKQLGEDPDSVSLLDRLRELKKERREVGDMMEQATIPLEAHRLHSLRLLTALDAANGEDRDTLRRELRQCIRAIVRRIDVSCQGRSKGPKAVDVALTFADGQCVSIHYRVAAGRVVEGGIEVVQGENAVTVHRVFAVFFVSDVVSDARNGPETILRRDV